MSVSQTQCTEGVHTTYAQVFHRSGLERIRLMHSPPLLLRHCFATSINLDLQFLPKVICRC
eukprot:247027-Amphidinium_carterae.1